jgi:hypothetical protein
VTVKPITLVVVGKDVAATAAWFQRQNSLAMREYAHVVLVANYPAKSLSRIGNGYLDEYMPHYPSPVFGMIHADTFFGIKYPNPDLRILYDCAMLGNVCGIVGADTSVQRYWWGHSLPYGTEHMVSTLDGCAVFFRRDLGLRFDEAIFTGLHCHVEDLCLQAHARGIPVIVPSVKATHTGESTVDPAWQEGYARWRKVLVEKWKDQEVVTT